MGNTFSWCGQDTCNCYSCCDEKRNNSQTQIVLYSLFILRQLDRTPRSPQDSHLVVDYKGIDREKSVFIFCSHNWLRGWPGAKDYNVVVPPLDTPKPHPDTANHDKFKLLIEAIQRMKKAYFPDIDEENIYVWIDYGCINQDVAACDGLKMLDKVMSVCDLMLTTIYDDNWSRDWGDKLAVTGINDWLQGYGSPAWNQGDHSYLKRAWCLVEMMYASNIPLVTSSAERLSMFRGVLLTCIEQNRRPHLLMGTNELERNQPPIVLPPMRSIYFVENDPRRGKFTMPMDKITIRGLVNMLILKKEQGECRGYVGDKNIRGRKHGQGIYTYADGALYRGDWKDDSMHGYGAYTFANGNLYEGEFKAGKQHGQGTFTFVDGDEYQGEFKDDNMHGHGTFTYAYNGDKYQGEYRGDNMHGQGTFTYANGNKYQGEWKDDMKHGQGTYTLADGSIAHNGEWKDGQPVGKSYPRDEHGWITKRGQMYPSWKKRYFRLKMGVLEYYTEESCRVQCLKGSVSIAGYNIDTSTPLQIYISSSGSRNRRSSLGGSKDMYMKFDNEGDKERWLKALQASV